MGLADLFLPRIFGVMPKFKSISNPYSKRSMQHNKWERAHGYYTGRIEESFTLL